jgi:hypothetical protein
LYGLSQEYWRPKILFAIASSIGTPICTDAIASKPMFERTFGQYARVLVDMDLSQTLRYKVLVERKGYAFFVDLDYENLPDFCTHCKMVGHYVEVCKKLQNQEIAHRDAEPKQKSKPRVEKKYVKTNVGNSDQVKVTEVIDVDVPKHPDEGGKSQPVIADDSTGESSKTKSQALPEASPVQVEQQNIFHCLADATDGVVGSSQHSKSKDNIDDVELVNDESLVVSDDDNSSHDSAFVDATQFQKDDTLVEQQPILTPVRVQKDMAFLKESWVNMVEMEENQNIDQADTSVGHLSEDGFQVKLSKNQKKAQKKASQSSKDSYATRSKVNLKPFK